MYTFILYYRIIYLYFVIYSDVLLNSNDFLRIPWTHSKLTKSNWIVQNSWKINFTNDNTFCFNTIWFYRYNRITRYLVSQTVDWIVNKTVYSFVFVFVIIQDWLLPWNIIRSSAQLHKSPSMKFIESKGIIFWYRSTREFDTCIIGPTF